MIKRLFIDAFPFEKEKAFGYQEYLFNLLHYFNNNREELQFSQVIILCHNCQVQYFKEFENLEAIGFHYKNILDRIFVQNILAFKLSITKNDTVLFTGNYSSIFKRGRHILVIHDLLYLRKSLLPKPLMRWQRNLFLPISARLADRIIAISEFTRQDIIKNIGVNPAKIHKIYNYFNFSKYDKHTEIREEDFFLSVSSSEHHKNLATLLKAFNLYCKINEETSLYIVANLKGEAEAVFNSLNNDVKNRVKIFSNIDNRQLGILYSGCKAFISSSLFEGLGMPVVEAMYFNCNLIISDLQVFREITAGNANFFDPNSSSLLCNAMLNFNQNNMNLNEIALDKFSVKNTSEQYLHLLNGY